MEVGRDYDSLRFDEVDTMDEFVPIEPPMARVLLSPSRQSFMYSSIFSLRSSLFVSR